MALDIEPIAPRTLEGGSHNAKVIATASSGDATFEIVEGLSDDLITDLTLRSQDMSDHELVEQTSDKKRFAPGAYDAWFAKERYPYALVDANKKLAALIWYGPENAPDGTDGDTIAFRAYPPYRGAGLMGSFSRFVIARHTELRGDKQLWLATKEGNEAGIRLYERLGFVRTGTQSGTVYMSLS